MQIAEPVNFIHKDDINVEYLLKILIIQTEGKHELHDREFVKHTYLISKSCLFT